MSTENEGAAVPPAAQPPTAPPSPGAAPEPAPAPPAPDFAPTVADHDPATSAGAPATPVDPAARPSTPGGAAHGAPGASADQGPYAAGHSGAPAADVTAVGGTWAHQTPPPPPYGGGQPGPGYGGGQGDPAGQGGQGAPGGQGGHPGHPGYGGGPAGPPGPWGAPSVPLPPGPAKRSGGIVAAVLAAALVAGGVGGGIGYFAADRNDSGNSTTVAASGDPKKLNRAPDSVAGIAAKTLPSVVTIDAQGSGGEGGTGTGFVYDKQGHILTNNHVVASAAEGGKLNVTFSNGKKYAAEVVGRAKGYDVAVIKLKNVSDANLTPLPLGDSDASTKVGDSTIAIGAPFGLSNTVTTGIISAKNRPVASGDGTSKNASYMSGLQTDASINPGNSGGPLLNAQGAVIGINSAIQSAGSGGGPGESQQSGSIGLGFAIPINQAKRVADTLIKTGQPVYPRIGVQVAMQEQGEGARISKTGNGGSPSVTPNGPADKAGLKPGDVITKLNDTVIDSGPTLISNIWMHKPGEKVTLTYKRDGKQATAEVTLGEQKGDS
ncbi:S1C family serine protease [Streptomyces sp. H27-D2]|uniref:S1C family serine protease n=1 Tax=Streptomyces sp. H27-D2 TaxID=3046304 RepID=UPI002DBBD920|nr:trypsin-like peptidase domain-containing protein [Streptomyces sp. H27-D2]MEC4018884.1 trypsin-like peptidase domain-containing protein [Streptomyces sp. H27-D2]